MSRQRQEAPRLGAKMGDRGQELSDALAHAAEDPNTPSSTLMIGGFLDLLCKEVALTNAVLMGLWETMDIVRQDTLTMLDPFGH